MRWEAVPRAVEAIQHVLGNRTIADRVQDLLECGIGLSEDFSQFKALEAGIAPNMGVKEPAGLIVLRHVVALLRIPRRHWSKLVWIAKHDNLSPAEGEVSSTPSNSQGSVYGIH